MNKNKKYLKIATDISMHSPLKKELLSKEDVQSLKKISDVALAVLAVAGTLTVATVAP